MAKYRVQLARLVRETRTIVVEAEKPEDLDKAKLNELYEEVDANGHPENYEFESDWEPDVDWGCDEGTHTVLGKVD